MTLAAAAELARFAEARGIREDDIIPRMEEWEVFPRQAVATAMKAQQQGIARLSKTQEQLYKSATKVIRDAREATQLLMKEWEHIAHRRGLDPSLPAETDASPSTHVTEPTR
jgi:malate dehydrogenase (oxaloacetate-decarboxylating)